jgi:rod shape-determining protein MreD
MQQIFTIILMVLGCFVIESIFSQLFNGWFTPNLLLVLVVFFNLFRGIRYSLFTAVLAGLLNDSFSARAFGVNMFSFIACAYLTSLVKMYVYEAGSRSLRVVVVFVISLANVVIQYLLYMMTASVDFGIMFSHVLLPEVVMTVLVTTYAFKEFKRCALKLFA